LPFSVTKYPPFDISGHSFAIASLDNLLDGYRVGCQSGDLEYAFYCLQRKSVLQLHSGVSNLTKLEQEMRNCAKEAMLHGQITATILIVTWLSAVLEIKGDTGHDDPYHMYLGSTEAAFLQQQIYQKNFSNCHV
jgi:hypothetical protein